MTDRRRLIVMRHAKAEPFAASDHARRLTDRGLASAVDLGIYLREHDLVPDFALVSSAVRTKDTWSGVVEASGFACEVSFDEALFNGSADVVLDALRGAPPEAGTVVFVGHNPTAEYVCHLLDDGDGEESAVSEMLKGFPPGALAVLEVSVPWSEIGESTGRVIGYYVGHPVGPS